MASIGRASALASVLGRYPKREADFITSARVSGLMRGLLFKALLIVQTESPISWASFLIEMRGCKIT